MSTRVGGPPRGVPPTGGSKVGAPKGAPPGGKAGRKMPGGPKGKAPGGGGASNANIPNAPSVQQYICFIKGEPFTGAAATSPAPGGDDLDLDAAADIADMSAIIDGLDGGDSKPTEPFTVDEPA